MPPHKQPQTFHLSPTPYVPNSRLPALVYRAIFPTSSPPDGPSSDTVCEAIEPNHWLKGGIFHHYATAHFHSVTHEFYVILKGSSKIRLGQGPLDEDSGNGVVVDLSVGDCLVVPAGVAHCSLESSDDYEYIGLYPEGSPHWDMNFCKADDNETAEKAINARDVPVPECDPIYGEGGPLVDIWNRELSSAA